MSPARRTARLIRLLRERPHTLAELQELLQISGNQLRRDLDAIREEHWPLQEQGGGPHQPKQVWIEPAVIV